MAHAIFISYAAEDQLTVAATCHALPMTSRDLQRVISSTLPQSSNRSAREGSLRNRRILLATALTLILSAPAPAQSDGSYRGLSQPSHQTVTDFEVLVPMRDGIHLAANVVRPVGSGKFPVLISYIPYGKDPDPFFAQRGYVTIFAEARGTGTSEGVMADYFDAQSLRDGYEAAAEEAARAGAGKPARVPGPGEPLCLGKSVTPHGESGRGCSQRGSEA